MGKKAAEKKGHASSGKPCPRCGKKVVKATDLASAFGGLAIGRADLLFDAIRDTLSARKDLNNEQKDAILSEISVRYGRSLQKRPLTNDQ
jgi:hypothetical protein